MSGWKKLAAASSGSSVVDNLWAIERYGPAGTIYIYLFAPDLSSKTVYTVNSSNTLSNCRFVGNTGAKSLAATKDGSLWFSVKNNLVGNEMHPARCKLDGTIEMDANNTVRLAINGEQLSVVSTEDYVYYHPRDTNKIIRYPADVSSLGTYSTSNGTIFTINNFGGGDRGLTYAADQDIILAYGKNTSATDYIYAADMSGTPSFIAQTSSASGGLISGDYYNATARGGSSSQSLLMANSQYSGDIDKMWTVNSVQGANYYSNGFTHNEYAYGGITILSQYDYGVSWSYYDNSTTNRLYTFSASGSGTNYPTSTGYRYSTMIPSGYGTFSGWGPACASPVDGSFYVVGPMNGGGGYNSDGKDIAKFVVSSGALTWDTSTAQNFSSGWQSASGGNRLAICHSTPDTYRQLGV